MIKVVESGRNPTMRYIGRTHGVSVAWLHETFKSDDLDLAYEVSSRMCADIYTKAFTDADKWRLACWLINICDPKELNKFARQSNEWNQTSAAERGVPSTTQKPAANAGGPTENYAGPLAGGDSDAGGKGSGPLAAANPKTCAANIQKPQNKELKLKSFLTFSYAQNNKLFNTLSKTFGKKANNVKYQNRYQVGQPMLETELCDGGGDDY